MPLDAGSPAPDFELPNQFGERVSLSGLLENRPVVLVFFPLAFSPTCTGELGELRDNKNLFAAAGVHLVGVSVDSKASLRAFSERDGYDFPLLADFWPHGAVAASYGALDHRQGYAERATFVIDRAQIIRSVFAAPLATPRAIQDYRDALDLLLLNGAD